MHECLLYLYRRKISKFSRIPVITYNVIIIDFFYLCILLCIMTKKCEGVNPQVVLNNKAGFRCDLHDSMHFLWIAQNDKHLSKIAKTLLTSGDSERSSKAIPFFFISSKAADSSVALQDSTHNKLQVATEDHTNCYQLVT